MQKFSFLLNKQGNFWRKTFFCGKNLFQCFNLILIQMKEEFKQILHLICQKRFSLKSNCSLIFSSKCFEKVSQEWIFLSRMRFSSQINLCCSRVQMQHLSWPFIENTFILLQKKENIKVKTNDVLNGSINNLKQDWY